MERVLLFVALVVVISAGCRKRSRDPDPAPSNQGGGGFGAVQNVRGAVNRTVTQAEMHDLHIFMTNAKLSSGKVPNSQETWAAISGPSGNRQLAKLIQDKVITLVPNPQDEGLWAYGTEVPTQGGIILTHSGVERITAGDYSSRFGRQ